MTMYFKITHDHGGITGVEREGEWPERMMIDPSLLDTAADERWVSHGDGLVTFRTNTETATYGLEGEAALEGEAVVGPYGTHILSARLLSVRPRGEG